MKNILILTTMTILFAGFFDNDSDNESDIVKLLTEVRAMVISNKVMIERLDMKIIGYGKHLATMQNEVDAYYAPYEKKVVEIEETFDRADNRINDLEETITQRLDGLSEEVSEIDDFFDANRIETNKDLRPIRRDIKDLGVQIESLDRQLNPKKYESKKK